MAEMKDDYWTEERKRSLERRKKRPINVPYMKSCSQGYTDQDIAMKVNYDLATLKLIWKTREASPKFVDNFCSAFGANETLCWDVSHNIGIDPETLKLNAIIDSIDQMNAQTALLTMKVEKLLSEIERLNLLTEVRQAYKSEIDRCHAYTGALITKLFPKEES